MRDDPDTHKPMSDDSSSATLNIEVNLDLPVSQTIHSLIAAYVTSLRQQCPDSFSSQEILVGLAVTQADVICAWVEGLEVPNEEECADLRHMLAEEAGAAIHLGVDTAAARREELRQLRDMDEAATHGAGYA